MSLVLENYVMLCSTCEPVTTDWKPEPHNRLTANAGVGTGPQLLFPHDEADRHHPLMPKKVKRPSKQHT